MMVCQDCGFRNTDKDAFCGSCGSFLEWSGEKVETTVSAELVAEADEAAASPRPGLIQRVHNSVRTVFAAPAPMVKDGGAMVRPGMGGPGGAPGGPPGLGRPPGLGAPPGPGAPQAPSAPPGLGMPPTPPRPPGLGMPPTPPRPPGLGTPPTPPRPPGLGTPPTPGAPPGLGTPPTPPRPPGLGTPPTPGALRPQTAPGRPPGYPGDLPRTPSPPARPGVGTDDDSPDEPDIAELSPGPVDDVDKLVAPVVGKAKAPDDGLVEMAPQATRQRVAPVRKQGPTRKLNPGDLVCGECGEGNRPPRKFCHRCGASLLLAEVVKQPWWRRFFRSRAKVRKAGTRPKNRGSASSKISLRAVFRKVRGVIAAVLVVSGILFGVYPPFRTYVMSQFQSLRNTVVEALPSPDSPVRPAVTEANGALDAHGGPAAFDLATNTYWAAEWGADRPKLTIDLGKTVALRKLIITGGGGADFAKHHRPARLLLSYSNEQNESIPVQDTPQPQEIELRAGLGVTTLTIEVLDVHRAADGSAVAITEIELFGVG